MRIYIYILAAVLSLITSQAFAAASLVPAFGVISSATGGKVSAAQQGTNTLNTIGATVGKVGGRPTFTVNDQVTGKIIAPADVITMSPTLDVRAYGGINGISDDVGFSRVAGNNRTIILQPATYVFSTQLTIAATNLVIQGQPGTVITSSTLYNLIALGSCTNVTFKNIKFQSTAVQPVEDLYGLISSNQSTLSNVTFENCEFTCPNAATNGVKIIQYYSDSSDQVHFRSCIFHDIGRMGIEITNHNDAQPAVRYSHIEVTKCQFTNLGGLTSYGQGVSLSGYGNDNNISNNIFNNTKFCGIELVGPSNTVVAYNSFTNEASYDAIQMTGSRVMTANKVHHNKCLDQCQYVKIWTNDQISVHDNTWLLSGYFYLRSTTNSTFDMEHIDSTGNMAFYLEGTSTNNTIANSTLSTANSANNFAVIRNYNTSSSPTFATVVRNCTLMKPSGGGYADGQNGADTPAEYFNTHVVNGSSSQAITTLPAVILSSTSPSGIPYNSSSGSTLSADLETNGNFATASGWTLETGWSYGTNQANFSGSSGAGLYQNLNAQTGTSYQITFTITSITSGYIEARAGVGFGPQHTTAGTYTDTVVCSGGSVLGVQAGGATSASVTNISIKQVIPLVGPLVTDSTFFVDANKRVNAAGFVGPVGLSGTTGSIGGSALTAGQCTSGTVAITGATTSMGVAIAPSTYPGDGVAWRGYVSSAGTVTVKVCGEVALTPVSSTYNVRVLQ